MHIPALVVLLISVDASRLPYSYNDEVVSWHYQNHNKTEEAQLVTVAGRKNDQYYIRIGNRYKSGLFYGVANFEWSPDDKHFFIIAEETRDEFRVIQDGVLEYRLFERVLQIQWSQNSKHLAYIGCTGLGTDLIRSVVVWDGVPIKTFREITDFYFDIFNQLVFAGSDADEY